MEVVTKQSEKSISHSFFYEGSETLNFSVTESARVNIETMVLLMESLADIIRQRTNGELGQQDVLTEVFKNIQSDVPASSFYKLCEELTLSEGDQLLLVLAYTAQSKPWNLDVFLTIKPENNQRIKEYGGVLDGTNGKFLPTLQTAVYLLAGQNDVEAGIYYEKLRKSVLFREQVLRLRPVKSENDHPLSHLLELNLAYYHFFTNGEKPKYEESDDFPAYLLHTHKNFDDLILKETTKEHLQGPMNFVRHYDELFRNKETYGIIKPGYVVMLYGPPGTGKTMTAAVMGKELGVDVYAVNLSRIVSKYIGETEKNLEKVFNLLSHKRCILFFDEADALFGKRTEVNDSKDRYANQEVAYLLQKIEQFPGLVLLASNFRQNLDEAFKRRIINSILIPPPDEELRRELWKKAIPPDFSFEEEQLAHKLAERFPLTGANIANVVKLSCIEALSRKTRILSFQLLEHYVKFELIKEGKNAGISTNSKN